MVKVMEEEDVTNDLRCIDPGCKVEFGKGIDECEEEKGDQIGG